MVHGVKVLVTGVPDAVGADGAGFYYRVSLTRIAGCGSTSLNRQKGIDDTHEQPPTTA
jgi:hypothetical protein